jgi:ABC-2 type transport system permease protein
MMNDVATVIWKEWKELVARSSQARSESFKTVGVFVVIIGIIVWRASFLANNLASLAFPSIVLVQLLAALMSDSFAGERERHTLETLLASRLSDLAILIGKILAGVLLAWGLIVVVLGLVILAAYVHNNGPIALSMADLGAILVIYLFICMAMSCGAVLVSLRARTVRQAMQTLMWSFMILFFGLIFGISRLPAEWRLTLMRALSGEHLLRTEIVVVAVLAGLTTVLFGAARLRFQRARLIHL